MLSVLLALPNAFAADVDPFRPSGSLGSGRGTLQAESPVLLGDGLGLGLKGSFAQDLAVRDWEDRPAEALVAHVMPLELYGAWTLEDRGIRIEGFAPLYASVAAPGNDFGGPALGDLRLQANFRLKTLGDGIVFGVLPRIELPTGSKAASTGRGINIGFAATSDVQLPYDLSWVSNAGLTLAGNDDLFGFGAGSTLDLVTGVSWQIQEGLRAGVEVDGRIGLAKGTSGSNSTGTWHVFAQNRLDNGLGLTVGFGSGWINGLGAPDYRVFSALTYQVTVRDADEDGLVDKVDACPTAPEDLDGFEDTDGCPDPDNDADTVLDADDTCPLQAEDADGFEDTDGCPDPDNDGDGILDEADQCIDIPGVEALAGCPDRDTDGITDTEDACPDDPGPVELQGCPDRDLDRVPDIRDACPDEPIPPSIDPATSDGCPKLAYLTEGRIQIFEKVNFETGRAKVAESSNSLLEAVATVFRENPGVQKVEIAGHTDNVGSDRFNQRLSQKRAAAVLEHLVTEGGIARERLTAKGYGEANPLTTNRTEAGRARNRRVEFVVLEQKLSTQELPPLETVGDPTLLWDTPTSDVAPASPTPGPVAPVWDTPPGTAPGPVWDTPDAAPSPVPPPVEPAPGPVAPAWDTPTPAQPTSPDIAPPTPVWDAPAPVPAAAPLRTAPAPTAPAPTAPAPAPSPAPVVAPVEPPVTAPSWDTPATEAPEPEVPAASPAPEEVSEPAPVALPTTAVVVDPSAPAHAGTTDPRGAPAKLTVQLGGRYSRATVYIDNEPLPRPAPVSRFPVLAGEHKVWIQDDATGLDHEETLTFHNGEIVRMVLPIGAEVGEDTGPVIRIETPPEKRRGRRSRKR